MASPGNITVVRTAEDLNEAAVRGAQDIEIQEHIDLRRLQPVSDPATQANADASDVVYPPALLDAVAGLRSIRVRSFGPFQH